MAEPAEAPARQPAGKSDNIFTRKIGPMPMWAWLAIVSVLIIGWAWYQNKKNPAAQSGTANASQVPQFVNQTYTTVTPPVAPTPGKPPPDKDGGDKDGKDKDGGGKGKGGGDSDEAHDVATGHDKDMGPGRRRHRRRHPTHHHDTASMATSTQAAAPTIQPGPPRQVLGGTVGGFKIV